MNKRIRRRYHALHEVVELLERQLAEQKSMARRLHRMDEQLALFAQSALEAQLECARYYEHQMIVRMTYAEKDGEARLEARSLTRPKDWREMEIAVALQSGWPLHRTRLLEVMPSGRRRWATRYAVGSESRLLRNAVQWRRTVREALEDLPHYLDDENRLDFLTLVYWWQRRGIMFDMSQIDDHAARMNYLLGVARHGCHCKLDGFMRFSA